MKTITMDKFGKDHWSTFAYIETRCVENLPPERDRMRVNATRHPGLVGARQGFSEIAGWKPKYSTRLKGHTKETPVQQAGHDDWDCAYDLEAAGLLEDVGTGIHPLFKLTTAGLKLAAEVRAHRCNGGSFATFTPQAEVCLQKQ